MRVTIDRVGRVVIPKAVRDALGLVADTEFDLEIDGVSIRLDPIVQTRRVIMGEDGLPVLEAVEGLVITDEDIRRARDEVQLRDF